MPFALGYRRGYLWEDTLTVEKLVKEADYKTSGAGEREFEIQTASMLKSNTDKFSHHIISQYHKDGAVASAYFFGKNHRPDISIDEYGTAIELKFVDKDLNGVKYAIGQSLIYRLQYKFTILIFIISKEHKELYERAYLNQEPHFDELLRNIEAENNIFSIVKPSFKPRKGLGETISYFPSN